MNYELWTMDNFRFAEIPDYNFSGTSFRSTKY